MSCWNKDLHFGNNSRNLLKIVVAWKAITSFINFVESSAEGGIPFQQDFSETSYHDCFRFCLLRFVTFSRLDVLRYKTSAALNDYCRPYALSKVKDYQAQKMEKELSAFQFYFVNFVDFLQWTVNLIGVPFWWQERIWSKVVVLDVASFNLAILNIMVQS